MIEAAGTEVTVCIPAYRSAAFIERTLEAVSAQTFHNFRALISIDGPDPETESVCRRFADRDSRFQTIVQQSRLGWLGNTNALFDRVTTPFFCIMPHDDFIAPTYLETLLREAKVHPEALVVFCDMERVGVRRHDFRSTPNLHGPFRDRLFALLTAPTEAVAWRGLTRASVLQGGRRMRENAFENYNAHALWVVELLCLGPFHRVAEPLYRQWERVDDTSVTTGWRSWPSDRRYAALAEYTLHCINIVSTTGEADDADRRAVITLLLLRLLGQPAALTGFEPRARAIDPSLIRMAELLGRLNGLTYLDESNAARMRDDKEFRRLAARLRLRDATEALTVKDLAAAAVAADAAAAMDPRMADALLRKCQVLRRQGDPVAAAEAARAALELEPKLPRAHFQLSASLAELGHFAAALEAVDAALALDPKNDSLKVHREKVQQRYAAAEGPTKASPDGDH